ncbi:hypothetical protein DENSPDRAFT_881721 [Dentipellis sp. KUC8613]|nr:hypothetical protein DENSPDRAFT_881721 [Dentipellis sp. KUC8613]
MSMPGPFSARDLFDLVWKIKTTIEKVVDNRRELKSLSDDLVEDIKRLLNCLKVHHTATGEQGTLNAEFSYMLSTLKTDLLAVLKHCEALVTQQTQTKRRIRNAFRTLYHVDDIRKEIEALRFDVNQCYQRFTATGMSTVAHGIEEIQKNQQELLTSLKRNLSTSVTQAASNRLMATRLTGADQMDKATMSRMLKKSKELLENPNDAFEKRYLKLKVDTLRKLLKESLTSTSDNGDSLKLPVGFPVLHSNTDASSSVMETEDAVVRCSRLLQTLKEQAPCSSTDRETQLALAQRLNILAVSLSEIGLVEDAAQVFEQILQMYKTFFQEDVAAYREQLATTLNNYTRVLSMLDPSCAWAIVYMEEAVQHFRVLADETPSTFKPYLITSLNNLSIVLHHTGDTTASLALSEEAIGIARPLADLELGCAAPLAVALVTKARTLLELGRAREGIQDIQDAVNIYQKLVDFNPRTYLFPFADSLAFLSDFYRHLGDDAEALHTIQQAVEADRALHLIPSCSQSHRYNFSLHLHTLFLFLRDVDPDGALQAIAEVVDLRRQLAQEDPAKFDGELASSLHNLAAHLYCLKHYDAAASIIEEAVEMRLSIVKSDPSISVKLQASQILQSNARMRSSNIKVK